MQSHEAEENLRVIRSLMEKATIYRAISAPTALVGGIASFATGVLLHYGTRELQRKWGHWTLFVAAWVIVLLITAAANTWFLWRDARRRAEPFISAGMRRALKCLAPPLLCGAYVTFFDPGCRDLRWLPILWMIFYGLALLAAGPFAPTSIPRLGWVFIVFAFVAAFSLEYYVPILGDPHLEAMFVANVLMVSSFGFLHLIYAVFTWPRSVGKKAAH